VFLCTYAYFYQIQDHLQWPPAVGVVRRFRPVTRWTRLQSGPPASSRLDPISGARVACQKTAKTHFREPAQEVRETSSLLVIRVSVKKCSASQRSRALGGASDRKMPVKLALAYPVVSASHKL
jgi:hypothetical protein